jgi:hypothetical protein
VEPSVRLSRRLGKQLLETKDPEVGPGCCHSVLTQLVLAVLSWYVLTQFCKSGESVFGGFSQVTCVCWLTLCVGSYA